jgi:hypothetical protein
MERRLVGSCIPKYSAPDESLILMYGIEHYKNSGELQYRRPNIQAGHRHLSLSQLSILI